MTETAHTTKQGYWLLIGDLPVGPFDVPQIHAKLASGDVTWQSLACPVGGGTWLPLVKVPGIGPVPLPPPTTSHPSVEAAGPALASVAPATASPAARHERWDGALQDRQHSASIAPFRFRSGGEARTLDELVALCESHWQDAEWHLGNGDLERWFRESGQGALAEKTEKARTSGWLARQSLTYVLKECGESGGALASRIEAEEAVRRHRTNEEHRRAEGNGEQEKSASIGGCPKCGKNDRLQNGFCYHCGYSVGKRTTSGMSAKYVDCSCGKRLEVNPEQAGMPVQCPFCKAVVPTPVATARPGPANADQDFANAVIELICCIGMLLVACIWLADSPAGKFVGMAGLLGIGHATKKLRLW